LFWQPSSVAEQNEYDDLIKSASLLYTPQWDWRWYRSQLEQESLLDPNAVSHVGAVGIAQFMPATWADMQRELRFTGSRTDAYKSIRAGAYYNRKLRKAWKWKRPECDRRQLVFASYNAGLGNILKSQRYCAGATHWPQIKLCLHRVTGEHANETTGYVDTIEIRYEKQIGADFTCDYSHSDSDHPASRLATQKSIWKASTENLRSAAVSDHE